MLDSHSTTQELSLSAGSASSPISYADAIENYRKNTDWWIVFDAFDLPNSVGSAMWISARTGLSIETVTEAIEGLLILGHVIRSEKGFQKVKSHMTLPRDPSKLKRMEDHSLVSKQILHHVDEQSKGAFRVASFASNNRIIAEMYAKIDAAIMDADEKSKKLSKNEIENIYLSSITFVTAINSTDLEGAKNV